MIGDSLAEPLGRSRQGLHHLRDETHIGRIADIGRERGRAQAQAPRRNRFPFHQCLDEFLIEFFDTLFAKAFIQFNQGCSIRYLAR